MIEVVEKPDWVSWDNIHDVVWAAHEGNRKNGIYMRNPSLLGREIEALFNNNKGIMLVALSDSRVVGTAGFIVMKRTFWYNDEEHAHLCFDAILPDYNGQGIYRVLCSAREKMITEMGLNKLYMDTHHNNKHTIQLFLKNGYKKVGVKDCGDHWNVVLFKWLNGCPYTEARCQCQFFIKKYKMYLKRCIKKIGNNA